MSDKNEKGENNLDKDESKNKVEGEVEGEIKDEVEDEIKLENEGENKDKHSEQEKQDENNEEDKNGFLKNKKNIFFISLATILVVGCLCVSVVVKKYENIVYPGTTLYGESIEKLDENDLLKKINYHQELIDKKELKVKFENNMYIVKMSDLVKDYNKDKLKRKILDENKDKNSIEKFTSIITKKERDYKFNLEINKEKVDDLVHIINKENKIDIIEPKVKIEQNNISIEKGKSGYELNVDDFKNDILNALNNKSISTDDIVVTCKLSKKEPTINTKELKSVNHKISSYSTRYSPSGGRGKNIELATKKIDDLLLMPGQEFSYEKAISPITPSNGYKNAPVIINGSLKDGIGGGVCQVSSTLYNTQLKAGILPTERRNHSKPVNYVPRGLDATLATGSIDYKFKNTLDYPLVINSYTSAGSVVIEFWSNKEALKNMSYEAVGYASGNVANTYLYGYDEKGKKVYEKHIDTSIYR